MSGKRMSGDYIYSLAVSNILVTHIARCIVFYEYIAYRCALPLLRRNTYHVNVMKVLKCHKYNGTCVSRLL